MPQNDARNSDNDIYLDDVFDSLPVLLHSSFMSLLLELVRKAQIIFFSFLSL